MSDGEIAILGLLAEKARYGYELDKIIEHRGMREWTDIAFSSIYAVLRSLEQKELVTASTEVAGNRVRKLFSITKGGRRELKEALRALIVEPTPPRDPMMLALAYAGVLSGDETHQAFAARLDRLQEEKNRLTIKKNENAKSPANIRLMFERSLAQIAYEIEFAQSFISEVASAPSEPRNDVKREVASSPTEPAPRNDAKRPVDEPKDTLF